MIQVFCIEGDHLRQIDPPASDPLPAEAVWIDVLNPTAEETAAIKSWTGAELPSTEEVSGIEESSRFYMEDGAHYLTVPILHSVDKTRREIAPVSFMLAGRRLVTVRRSEPRTFTLFIGRATKPGTGLVSAEGGGMMLMLGIVEAAINRLADVVEELSADTDKISQAVFHRRGARRPMGSAEFRGMLTRLGGRGTLLSMVHESLSGIDRLLAYAAANVAESKQKDIAARLRSLDKDARALEHYVDFLSNKITFLLDTIVGLVTVEQNAIIKIFSVVAVVFMPPTLIASIYGMNFHAMPELAEWWGYPMALVAMALAAVLPLLYFRRKGWL